MDRVESEDKRPRLAAAIAAYAPEWLPTYCARVGACAYKLGDKSTPIIKGTPIYVVSGTMRHMRHSLEVTNENFAD